MITAKQEYSIRSGYKVPKSPLELLISKEELPAAGVALDAEILIFLADFASRFPNKWQTVKEKISDDRSTHEELAMRLRISPKTIARHLNDLRSEAKKWGGSPMVDYKAKSA